MQRSNSWAWVGDVGHLVLMIMQHLQRARVEPGARGSRVVRVGSEAEATRSKGERGQLPGHVLGRR
jgi:hypothetical protein